MMKNVIILMDFIMIMKISMSTCSMNLNKTEINNTLFF